LTYFDYISNNATGIATKFQCNIESPIDWARSKLVSMPRGFDTLNFNSTYVMSDEKNQKINDMVDQLSGGVSYSSFFVSANISGSISKRVRNASSTGKTEGSLVIGSFATTRHVRTFERLYYDTDKLRALKEHIQREKKQQRIRAEERKYKEQERKKRVEEMLIRIDKEKAQKGKTAKQPVIRTEEEIKTEAEDQQGRVYIISEAIMGGVFVGFVHFLKTEATTEKQKRHDAQVGIGGGYMGSGANLDYKKSSEKVDLNSSANTRVEIEFICYGTVPGFARKDVPYKISEFKDLNPSNFQLSSQDEADIKSVNTFSERQEAMDKQRLKMQYAGTVISNAVRETITAEKPQKVHQIESLYEAFESWIELMKKDENAGVPVGFNYRVLTENDIKELLANADKKNVSPDEKTEKETTLEKGQTNISK